MRNLLLLFLALPAYAQQPAREVNAGPIWNQADAQAKCPNVCRAPEKWNGQWRTIAQGRMSVCQCIIELDLSGGYEIRGRDHSESLMLGRDGRFTRANGETGTWTWDGRTLTLQQDPIAMQLQADGSFLEPQHLLRLVRRGPPPAPRRNPPEMVGQYQGVHPQWRDTVTLAADGRFARGNGDPGSWWFENNTLYLKWDRWGMASLALQPDGAFFDASQRFRLARAVQPPPPVVVQPPPPVVVQPPPPAHREFRSRYVHLDRGWYRPNEQAIVYWDNLPQTNGAWVSVVPRGTADGEWGDWSYTRGAASGSFTTKPLPAGEYEVRAYGGAMSPVVDRLIFTVGR